MLPTSDHPRGLVFRPPLAGMHDDRIRMYSFTHVRYLEPSCHGKRKEKNLRPSVLPQNPGIQALPSSDMENVFVVAVIIAGQ